MWRSAACERFLEREPFRRAARARLTQLAGPKKLRTISNASPTTREFALSPLPYLIVYTVRGDAIYVVRILHGAQQ
jgi:plasmid stabilization system protein ParE